MMECEHCGETVDRVLRHREYGVAMTHRVTRWLCRGCHPAIPTRGQSTTEPDRSAEPVVTDGGTAAACPECAAATADVHGIRDCVECRWTGR
jgi:hypothetical protein